MTRTEAIQIYNTEWWKEAISTQIVAFQLYEERLCMPFGEYHNAIEMALGHPVWSHEFAFPNHLKEEFEKWHDVKRLQAQVKEIHERRSREAH